jgi:hypothetical protein
MMGRQGGRGARGAAVIAVLAALATVAAPARADTSVTDATGLRDAIAAADPAADTTIILSGDTFDLSAGGPIVWTGTGTLTLAGDPTMHPALDAGGQSRVAEVQSGTLDLEGLTVTGGKADGDGGGVLVDGGQLVADQAAFLDNTASGAGGAIAVQTGGASVGDSTISGNAAGSLLGGGAIDAGAGAGTVALAGDTIAFNTGASTGAGGLGGLPFTVTDSIVALNRPRDCATPVLAGDHDLDSDAGCFLGLPGALTSAAPRLALPADNGGPTPSIALHAGSPAIDAGHDCDAVDQTGLSRVGGPCDIGAYEFSPPATPAVVVKSADTTSALMQAILDPTHGTFHVDYGLTDAYGSQSAPQPITGPSGAVTLDGLTPGSTYHYRLVVDGRDGDAATPDQTFTTATPPPAPPQVVTQVESQTVTVTVPVKPPVVEAVLLPPVLSNLRLTPTAIIPMGFGGSIARAHGARVSYTAMNSVLATFTVDRVARGLRRGATCARRRARSKGPGCDRFVRLRGTFSHQDVQGANAFRFTGGLNGKRLKPGRYRLNATPRDLTGRLGPTISATFRVVRR